MTVGGRRILFLTGVSLENGGGSIRSTQELAVGLGERGHDVAVLVGALGARRRRVYKRTVNLAAKVRKARARRVVDVAARQPGRFARPARGTPSPTWRSPIPENGLPWVLDRFPPEVVVVASVGRVAWARISATLRARRIPSVLYLRESVALPHLEMPGGRPDLVLANADSLGRAAAELGHQVTIVPSVVDVSPYLVESTRQTVLFVNPIASRGLETALALAAQRPDTPFVFLESHLLDDDAWRSLSERTASLPNVELRRRLDDPGRIYAEARVLLAPYQVPNRPRVVLEAQANGIPVLASRLGDLVPAVGPGGILVEADAPVEQWSAALSQLWASPAYDRFREAALTHAARDEVQPGLVVERVEEALRDLLAARAAGPRHATRSATGSRPWT